MSNKCPYCGAAVNRTMFNRFGKTEGYQALCRECGAIGPTNVVADDMAQKATITMFTQPAYLLNETGLIRLAADEVVVKREHLKNCLAALDDTTRAKINPGDPTAYGHIQQALAREVKS